ncbi:MAG: ion transporter [Ruminococcus sp.]|uniref:ion transporter n=1 Tax=Ruminococcus sp. TaxID=41978 RepID=UPI001B2667C3|nr:ion transporter [Ruminococcus sp.]MBO7472688.1 ion transporter [Ruminococcus sp.]
MADVKKKTLKRRIFDIIQIGNKDDFISRSFDWFIVTIIILNILTVFLDTFEELAGLRSFFRTIEAVTVAVFCVEYILRIWTADMLYPEKKGIKAQLRFLHSFDGIVDLLTILPFFFLDGFIVFRMLRVVRILHLFRVNVHYDSFHVITSVLVEKKNQIFSSVFIIIVLMLASSLGIYSAEHEAQPEAFSNAFSGIWWSVSTLLTVGYGDIYPITVIGKIMAILIAFLGVGVVAIPTGIISAGFVEQYTKKQYSDARFSDLSDVGEVLVDEISPFNGMSVMEANEKYNIRILVILRGELTVVPNGMLKIKKNDIIIVKTDKLIKGKNDK